MVLVYMYSISSQCHEVHLHVLPAFSKNLSFLYLSSVVNSHPQKNSFGTEEQKQIASLADSAKEHTTLLPTGECESASRSALWVGHANWILAGCNCPSQKYHIHHFCALDLGVCAWGTNNTSLISLAFWYDFIRNSERVHDLSLEIVASPSTKTTPICLGRCAQHMEILTLQLDATKWCTLRNHCLSRVMQLPKHIKCYHYRTREGWWWIKDHDLCNGIMLWLLKS